MAKASRFDRAIERLKRPPEWVHDFSDHERNVLVHLSAALSAAIRRARSRPPIGYTIGQLQSWGCWLQWCPGTEEHLSHLWSSVDEQGAQEGDGVVQCPDADGLPDFASPEQANGYLNDIVIGDPDGVPEAGCAW